MMNNNGVLSGSVTAKKRFLLYVLVFVFTFSEILLSSRIVFISDSIFKLVGYFINLCRIGLLCLFMINKASYRLNTFVRLFLMFCVILISHQITTIWALFDLFFLPFFLKELCDAKIYKVYACAVAAGCLVVFAAHVMHIMPELMFYRDNSKIRHAFGFSHPNILSRYVMLLAMLFVSVFKEKIKYRHIGLIFLSALFVYRFPNTNTVTLVLFFMTAALFANKYMKKKVLETKSGRIAMMLVIPCTILLFVGLTFYYSANILRMHGADNTLHARFIMGFRGIDMYGIHLLGNDIKFVSSSSAGSLASGEYFVIDSLFFYLPIRMGIIATALFLFLYMRLLYLAVKEQRFYDALIIILIGLYSFFENAILSSYAFVFSFIFIDNRFNISETVKFYISSVLNKQSHHRRNYGKFKY